GYGDAIEKAISELVLKPADYTKVNQAIEKANTLIKENYVDFTKVQAALDAVVTGKDITEQSVVNGYGDAIEKAISELVLKPVTPPVKLPEIIQGANQVVINGQNATFKSDADLDDFLRVLVDNEVVDPENYILVRGSTIVTLKSEYLKTLKEGKHTLTLVFNNGSASSEFTLKGAPETTLPDTGDTSRTMQGLALLSISLGLGMLVTTVKRKKETESN
ncbi:MAG: LPXTG cell wall anchor domain-containing protein, partial [Erysipelothrix sp.]|nr:LPXTG cell wall anchor domain-containing protein [Erysipelothrix sp.]